MPPQKQLTRDELENILQVNKKAIELQTEVATQNEDIMDELENITGEHKILVLAHKELKDSAFSTNQDIKQIQVSINNISEDIRRTREDVKALNNVFASLPVEIATIRRENHYLIERKDTSSDVATTKKLLEDMQAAIKKSDENRIKLITILGSGILGSGALAVLWKVAVVIFNAIK